MGSPRDALLVRLATVRRGRLLAVARSAGAGADAEDAVQDVLARLAAGAELPEDEARAVAYAATAVRRRAIDLRRAPAVEPEADAPVTAEPAEDHERRRALQAFAQAVAPLPERTRAVLVLDAAGWSRADVAGHLGVSERVVKRTLDRHRAGTVAAAAAAVGGADCARFAGTLQVYATGGRQARPDGPVAAHLQVCDACRLALVRARALRALLPAPPSMAVALPAAPAASLAALKLGAAVVAAISAAGGAALLVQPTGAAHTIPPARATITTPAAPPPPTVVAAPPRVTTIRVATRPHRAPAPPPPRRARRRHPAPAPARRATHRPGGCELGTLGSSGLGC